MPNGIATLEAYATVAAFGRLMKEWFVFTGIHGLMRAQTKSCTRSYLPLDLLRWQVLGGWDAANLAYAVVAIGKLLDDTHQVCAYTRIAVPVSTCLILETAHVAIPPKHTL
jgi:hypothetical protein